MRNHVEEYYRALQKPGGLRNAIIIALLIHLALAVAITAYISYAPARPEVLQVGIMIVPGEVKDPSKPTSVAAPAPQQGSEKKPEPEAPKKPEPPKPEPKPEPKEVKKEEPKPKEEEKKKEEKPKPEPKKVEPKEKEEPKKKVEPKKEEKKEEEKKKDEEKEPEKSEPPKKTDAAAKEKEKQAIKPTPGAKKTEDAELDMVMADVAEFADVTNPNNIDGPVTVLPGDMKLLGDWPALVKRQVDKVWRLPSGVSQTFQTCTLGFTVDRNGELIGGIEIVVESDNPAVTESALQALEVVRFPPLPDSYIKTTLYVEYNFKSSGGS